jgi:Ca-activated chloride channel family protein
MIFSNPFFLLLILFLPFYVLFQLKNKNEGAMRFSSIDQAKKIKTSLTIRLRYIPLWIRTIALSLIIVSLARPQKGIEHTTVPTEGIDIMLTLDVSTSMLAEDFTLNGKRANRLAALKPIVKKFIEGRFNDQIGMVVFAGRPYTQCPLTLDYGVLFQFLDVIEIGMVEDGTAIGSAITTAVNRLKDVPGKSKVIILLTDGRNNMGNIDPLTAAEIAKTMGMKIYTIGAGAKGLAPYPVMDPFGNKVYTRVSVDIDEDTLKKIADITGGQYFRATDTESLKEIYNQIDKMEKIKSEIKIYMEYKELFPYFLLPGFVLLFLEILISNIWLRRIP